MKKIFFLPMLIFISTVVFAQENSIARWAKNKISIDGNAADWNPPLKHYDNETNLFFDVQNDSNNLYLCFQAKDEITKEKIVRSGMKIILTDKMNGKHKSSINFPLGFKHSSKPHQENQTQENSPGHKIFADPDSMEVKGFTDENGLIPANDVSGIHAAIGRDSSNTLTYELAIPFKEMFGKDYTEKDCAKDISLNVIINAMPGGSQNRGDYSNMGGHGGRMGGGYGGMHGSHGTGHVQNEISDANSQTGSDRTAGFQKAELKEKFQLALPQ
ncbi:MAG: hypothetical protein ACTHK0_06465 [Ginsengibacter sp.]